MAARVVKGDEVIVISGKYKGKIGKVLAVLASECEVVVAGVNIRSKKQKANAGGYQNIEFPLPLSKVMHIDPSDRKPCRIGFKVSDGKKIRYSKRSGVDIQSPEYIKSTSIEKA
ncbi:50S ribosomal protein L24 [Candidatus Fokinia solitaria]|uniref:Large ribosomal subunit protein uL24 n=1 Tax=Candidatus Fokinia solitaria TaxID=1802984 RepID=A0A2U8BT10_9RICK|nr:50S ribosomal protein L24 [Candidatus Fokinia solitaria]AWD33491.1 50S ribosomal protein L24 [Candidatus Fokinia solitaria]